MKRIKLATLCVLLVACFLIDKQTGCLAAACAGLVFILHVGSLKK